jgi:NAD(P)-dependent dehydrogenase (short-subunit alcohol dehydrogenase family)
MTSSIEGKVALITGGSTGIGLATALRFAKEGAKVAIANTSVERGSAAVRTIQDAGGDAIFIQTDVSDPEQVKTLVAKVVDHYGQLNFAFNNAGVPGEMGPIHASSVENFDRIVNVNLKGVWLSMKYEIEHMMQNGGGVIVNTSSTAGGRAMAGLGAYAASKHGVNAITQAAALEYAPAGIRVNSVMPGPVETPMLAGIREAIPGVEDQFMTMVPQSRVGDASEVAAAVVWLCSDEASFVTATNLPVDGGMLAS